MKTKFVIYIVIWASAAYLLTLNKVNYSYESLDSYLTVLLAASSMVFTIMGIWIAFVYPNALKKLTNPDSILTGDFDEGLGQTRRLEYLVSTVMKSAIVVTAILTCYLVMVILPHIDFYSSHKLIIKSIGLGFVIVLGVVQLECIINVVFSNILFINELHHKKEKRELDNDT